jgi:hypothetical protein
MGDKPTFIDFDAAFDERDEPPIKVKVMGSEWELPGVMPAALPLKVARMVADGRSKDDFTVAETLSLAVDIIPKHVLDAWFDLGITVDRLGPIIERLAAMYMGKENLDPEELASAMAEATTPPSSSSSDGPTSRATSDASTASTSLETSPE